MNDRRHFLKTSSLAAAAVAWPRLVRPGAPRFEISLAEWSLHRTLQRRELDHLDFPVLARKTYGLGAVELVNSFFKDKARDAGYLAEYRRRANGEGVRTLLIMCDGEGNLGDPDAAKRAIAVSNHHRWVECASELGCHSIRVNAASSGTYEEQQRLAADGLRTLTEFGATRGINVIVENHGGLSSNGAWLAGVMKLVNHPRCGTLPDFGNFCLRSGANGACEEWYDRYQGVTELMPFAKAVSAKSHDFDDTGTETGTDYTRIMGIVLGAGYNGFVGIEYEGGRLGEHEGIVKTRDLLRRFQGS
jgi:sugar phosphate isomerase/epimerase